MRSHKNIAIAYHHYLSALTSNVGNSKIIYKYLFHERAKQLRQEAEADLEKAKQEVEAMILGIE